MYNLELIPFESGFERTAAKTETWATGTTQNHPHSPTMLKHNHSKFNLKNIGPIPCATTLPEQFNHSVKTNDSEDVQLITGEKPLRFSVPPKNIDYTKFQKAVFHPDHSAKVASDNPLIRVNSGTTTLGFVFNGGVV